MYIVLCMYDWIFELAIKLMIIVDHYRSNFIQQEKNYQSIDCMNDFNGDEKALFGSLGWESMYVAQFLCTGHKLQEAKQDIHEHPYIL